MNILQHFIVKVIHEEIIKSPYDGTEFYKVRLIEDCYGVEEITTQLFRKETWEKIKTDGYYMG